MIFLLLQGTISNSKYNTFSGLLPPRLGRSGCAIPCSGVDMLGYMGNCGVWTINTTVWLFESWPLSIWKQMCNSAAFHCNAAWTVQEEPLDKSSKGWLDCYTTGKLFSLNRWRALTKVSEDIRGFIDPLCLQMLPDNPCYQHQLKRMCRLLLTKLPKH